MNFTELVLTIGSVHNELSMIASRAVNASLTIRNWLIGCYIETYERNGLDRANYGDKLMEKLASSLTERGISRCERRELYRYRQFFLTYPQVADILTSQLLPLTGVDICKLLPSDWGSSAMEPEVQIVETVSPQFKVVEADVQDAEEVQNVSSSKSGFQIVETLSPQFRVVGEDEQNDGGLDASNASGSKPALQIVETVSPQFKAADEASILDDWTLRSSNTSGSESGHQIVETVSPQFETTSEAKDNSKAGKSDASNTAEFEPPIVETVSPQFKISGHDLVKKLSFSHITELIVLENNTQRAFYEFECIQGNWSVRELKRQIGSLYYERSGLSINKAKLSKETHQGSEQNLPALNIRDPYIFEFLGLKSAEVMSECQLEGQVLNKLTDFLLELGHGFCFEAQQKRILIGDTHYFVDLVFYHRILKCHVLIDLKLAAFSHENIGQLNTYVSWFRSNMMTEGDSFPIGILLCTQKDQALVEYALAGMDNNLFVSKYLLELPKSDEMQKFIEEQMRKAQAEAS